jgi:hypothetical protein
VLDEFLLPKRRFLLQAATPISEADDDDDARELTVDKELLESSDVRPSMVIL